MPTMIDRRQFLLATAATPVALASPVEDLWGTPVIDIHAHTRTDADANATHCDGAGISHAVLLTRTNQLAGARAAQAAHPDRFVWSASTDPGHTRPATNRLKTILISEWSPAV